MRKSDLKKLISQYKEIVIKQKKKNTYSFRLIKKLKEIEHRYYHETGRILKSDLKEFKEN